MGLMTWEQIKDLLSTFILALGGASAIALAVIKFSSSIIAERIIAKYENKLDEKLEKIKAELSKKEHVSKVRFDTEFQLYRDLSHYFSKAVKNVSLMIPSGFSTRPADKERRKEFENNLYVEANHAVVDAQNTLFANIAFIPEEIFNAYDDILGLCCLQLHAFERRYNVLSLTPQEDKERFSDNDYRRTEEINKKWRSINCTIREYLSRLDVVN